LRPARLFLRHPRGSELSRCRTLRPQRVRQPILNLHRGLQSKNSVKKDGRCTCQAPKAWREGPRRGLEGRDTASLRGSSSSSPATSPTGGMKATTGLYGRSDYTINLQEGLKGRIRSKPGAAYAWMTNQTSKALAGGSSVATKSLNAGESTSSPSTTEA